MLQKSAPCDYISYFRFTTSSGYNIRIKLYSLWSPIILYDLSFIIIEELEI